MTRSRIVALALSAVWFWSTSSSCLFALESSVEKSQEDLSKAYSNYFKTIVSGKAGTRADRLKLRQELIDPAANKLSEELGRPPAFPAASKHASPWGLNPSERKKLEGKIKTADKSVLINAAKAAPVATKASVSKKAPSAPDPAEVVPAPEVKVEVKVEGTEIKEFIEFKKKNSKAPPSSLTNLEPAAEPSPVKSDGVSYIEFPKAR